VTAAPGQPGRNALLDMFWRPDLPTLTTGLARWMSRHFPTGQRLIEASFPAEGGSSLNLMFSVTTDGPQPSGHAAHSGSATYSQYVARLSSPTPQNQTFPDEDLAVEARYMRLVRDRSGLPVPEVLYYEPDPSWLGAPFIVAPRLPGRPWPSDPPYNFGGWVLDASGEERARMQQQLVAVLARIHEITAAGCDLGGFARPELGPTALAAQVGYLGTLYEWGRGGVRYPLIEAALEYLTANLPAPSGPACITWGDARAGNLLFDDGQVSGVLDWEGAALGCPEVDVAFPCLMHRYYEQRAQAQGHPGLPDLFRPEEMAAAYEAVSGHRLGDLHWFEVLGATRAAAIQARFVSRAATDRPVPASGPHRDPDAALSIRAVLTELLETAT
jgi:aminoglycoside phosphotransferase (APT) family kinase protein